MEHAFDAVVEILGWVGLGAAVLLIVIALVLQLADGTWVRVRVLIEDAPAGGRIARWFRDDGRVGQAVLPGDLDTELAGKDAAELWTSTGARDRVRATRVSPAVRAAALLGAGFGALAVVAFAISLAQLFVRG